MLGNLLLSGIVYSLYLTLSEPGAILYMVILAAGMILGLVNIGNFETIGLLLFICNMAFYGFALFYVWRAWSACRRARENKLDEKLIEEEEEEGED